MIRVRCAKYVLKNEIDSYNKIIFSPNNSDFESKMFNLLTKLFILSYCPHCVCRICSNVLYFISDIDYLYLPHMF